MYPHKLKLHITGTFFGILIFAMLLINIVIFVFWNQHIMQQKIVSVKKTVRVWKNMHLLVEHDPKSNNEKPSLKLLCTSLGPECRQVILAHDQKITTAFEGNDKWGLTAMLTTAQATGLEMTQYIEEAEVPFFFTPKMLAIVLPNVDPQMSCCGIGVLLDTSDILSELWMKEKVIVLYLFFNAIVLTVVGFFRMRKLVLRPIESLVGVTENYHVSRGNGLFTEYPENEFGQLSRAMNKMVQRIEEDRNALCQTVDRLAETNLQLKKAQSEIIRAERLAVAGRLSAALAHEIGNPVSIVQGYVQLLEDSNISGNDRSDFSHRALDELSRIDNLIRQFLDVTCIREEKTEKLQPAVILLDVYTLLETSFKKNKIKPDISVHDDENYVVGDKELLRQVYLNCFMNSIDSVAERYQGTPGGKIEASISVLDNAKGKKLLVIAFQDNGSGIKEENLGYIFEPFFTTKDPGKGTGLGLAVSYRIIQSMGGQIEGGNLPSKGAFFHISLPIFVESDAGNA